MGVCGKREFELLNKIGFVRYGGSEEELKAANMLLDELNTLGVKGELEPFKVTYYDVKKVKFEVLEPFCQEYTVRGYRKHSGRGIDRRV